MRTYSTTIAEKTYNFEYPDEVCLAYNHNSLKILSSDILPFDYDITVGTTDIKVSSYNGSAEVYLSRLLQIHLVNIPAVRNQVVNVSVKKSGTILFNTALNVFFANLSIGERLDDYGAFAAGAQDTITRHLTWFCNYPFRFTYLGLAGVSRYARTDSGAVISKGIVSATSLYDEMLTPEMKNHVQREYIFNLGGTGVSSVFSSEFDYTFFQIGKSDTQIICKRNDAKYGYYLRWIDRRGYWQQWLFDRNTSEIKADASKDTIEEISNINGVQFSTERIVNIKAERIIKCMACNLDAEEYTNVESIATSCYVDLFMGYGRNNEELWLPVNIVSASHAKNDNRNLNNLEISFSFTETPQQL